MTGLDFLPKLSRVERRAALQQLFVAFLKTAQYVPPPGVTPEATTAATAPVILDAFTAQTTIQPEYGELLWYALLGASLDRDGWLRFLRELLPIAAAGYADAAKQWFYDSSLERAGLTWAEVATHLTTFEAALSIAQAEEARVAQAAGAGPLGEAELADELGLDPRRVAEPRRVGER